MTTGYYDYGFIVEGTHMEITDGTLKTMILERLKEAAVGRNSEGEPVNANEIIFEFLKDLGHTEIADAFKAAVGPRPIAGAPTDGTVVLLFGGKPSTWEVEFECFRYDCDQDEPCTDLTHRPYLESAGILWPPDQRTGWFHQAKKSWRYASFDEGHYGLYSEPPTHWMPLPSPPE